jgi:CBS domain-containing protein
MNVALAVFNLLPGLPLDGGRLLRATIWHFNNNFVKSTRIAAGAGAAIAYLLMAAGIVQMVKGGTYWAGGIWYLLIGWFLHNAAQGSLSQATLEQALAGAKVEDVMTRNVRTIPAHISLRAAVDNFFLTYRFTAFPVEEEGNILGIIHINDVQAVPQGEWLSLTVKETMKPLDLKQMVVQPAQEAVGALMKMAETGEGRLLVLDDTSERRLLGLVTRTDLMNLIRVKTGLGI